MRTSPVAYWPLLVVLSAALCGACHAAEPAEAGGAVKWYRGNLHTHCFWSDGDEFPENVVAWYRDHGYHFLALTDHDVFGEDGKWMAIAELKAKKRYADATIADYLRCDPASIQTRGQFGREDFQVRLRPFRELAAEFDRPGQFLLLPGEEITASKPATHVNAIGLSRQIAGAGDEDRRAALTGTLRAIDRHAQDSGRRVIGIINHPNFAWALTHQDLAAVSEARFVELFNGHPRTHFSGEDADPQRPGVERMWDLANTARLERGIPPLLALASDDTHSIRTIGPTESNPARGWVMVRAPALEPEALLAAMLAGQFYASSGVTLRSVTFPSEQGKLELEIEPDADATFTTTFLGSIRNDPARVGVVLARSIGPHASYPLTGQELFVRAVVTSTRPCPNPAFPGQLQQAWTQPAGWEMPPGQPGTGRTTRREDAR